VNKNLELFLTFIKIGAFTFGGGYAMIPLIQREVCDNKHWLNEDDILEVVAIAESTPGPVAINAATFVGSRTVGPSRVKKREIAGPPVNRDPDRN